MIIGIGASGSGVSILRFRCPCKRTLTNKQGSTSILRYRSTSLDWKRLTKHENQPRNGLILASLKIGDTPGMRVFHAMAMDLKQRTAKHRYRWHNVRTEIENSRVNSTIKPRSEREITIAGLVRTQFEWRQPGRPHPFRTPVTASTVPVGIMLSW